MRLLLSVLFLFAPLLGAETVVNLPGACDVTSYGVTGKKLPMFIQGALRALPADIQVKDEEVVYVTDLDKFAECHGLKDNPRRMQQLRESNAFCLDHKLPIYVAGYHPTVSQVAELYRRANVYLQFIAASWIGHETVHGVLHESAEVQPMQKELDLLRLYVKSGKLSGQQAGPWIQSAERRLALAWTQFRAGTTQVALATTATK